MAKYGEFYYGSGEVYGEIARESFSVEPFIADAVWYDKVRLTWNPPQAAAGDNYIGFRVVRNQFAYPETPDDGVILLDWPSEATVNDPSGLGRLEDTENLSRGKFAFYRIWLLKGSDSTWVVAGEAETLVPRENASRIGPSYIDNDGVKKSIDMVVSTTHDKLMGYLPKIFTTGNKVTDGYDPNSTLSRFLEGFSFTIDEFLTYTQLIVPGTSGVYTNAGILRLQSQQFGLSLDTEGLTKTQKKLVRNAVYLYSRKGTSVGISGFAEAVTGYPVTVSTTENLLLSLQDATFYRGLGNWKAVSGATIVLSNTVTPPAAVTGDLILDSTWTATVTTTTGVSGRIKLGEDDPIRTGIPVVAGDTYYLKFWIKSDSLTVSVSSMDINWFDERGRQIADAHSAVTGTVTSSWSKLSYNRTAPAGARFASINITFANQSAIYSIDRVQFYVSDISTYSEPRAAYIELSPTKFNYVKNPTFDADGTAWTVNNGTQTSPPSTLELAPSGSSMLRLVTSGVATVSSPYVAFSSTEGLFDTSQTYNFSIYVKSSAERTLTLNFYATDSTVGGPGTLESTKQITVGTNWARYNVPIYLTSEFTKANTNLFVKIYGGSSTSATIEFDCAQIEQGIYPTDYFDGSLTGQGAGWTDGVDFAHESTSFIYSNRDVKVSRLNSEIKDFIPINTGYFIKSLLALESSGITT